MAYSGLNRLEDGQAITSLDHINQSLRDILLTRKGTRVLRRDYGSGLPDLIDNPITPDLVLDLTFEIADAIDRLEPRLGLKQVVVEPNPEAGELAVELYVFLYPRGHLGDFSGAQETRISLGF